MVQTEIHRQNHTVAGRPQRLRRGPATALHHPDRRGAVAVLRRPDGAFGRGGGAGADGQHAHHHRPAAGARRAAGSDRGMRLRDQLEPVRVQAVFLADAIIDGDSTRPTRQSSPAGCRRALAGTPQVAGVQLRLARSQGRARATRRQRRIVGQCAIDVRSCPGSATMFKELRNDTGGLLGRSGVESRVQAAAAQSARAGVAQRAVLGAVVVAGVDGPALAHRRGTVAAGRQQLRALRPRFRAGPSAPDRSEEPAAAAGPGAAAAGAGRRSRC